MVDHPANVWFIDAHAEGDRRADDPRFIAQEKFLIARTFRGVESRVVGTGEEATTGQRFGHTFGGGPTRAVNDAALGFAGADEVDNLFRWLIFGDDAVRQIGAVEAGDKRVRSGEAEMFDNIIAHAAGGGGGEGHDGHARQEITQLGNLAIFGAKIVTPFRNTVGLIDG